MTGTSTAELDRRVAEHEGWEWSDDAHLWMRPDHSTLVLSPDNFPPPYRTDPAWWGPLIEKYRLTVWYQRVGCWRAEGATHNEVEGDTPGEAVCLAVLEIAND